MSEPRGPRVQYAATNGRVSHSEIPRRGPGRKHQTRRSSDAPGRPRKSRGSGGPTGANGSSESEATGPSASQAGAHAASSWESGRDAFRLEARRQFLTVTIINPGPNFPWLVGDSPSRAILKSRWAVSRTDLPKGTLPWLAGQGSLFSRLARPTPGAKPLASQEESAGRWGRMDFSSANADRTHQASGKYFRREPWKPRARPRVETPAGEPASTAGCRTCCRQNAPPQSSDFHASDLSGCGAINPGRPAAPPRLGT